MNGAPKTISQGMQQAVRLLSRREHASRELGQKLRQRGYSPSQIEEIIRRCQDLGYQDEGRFAEAYVTQLVRRGYGPHYIQQALAQKGLDSHMAHEVMRAMGVRSREAEQAQEVLLKKIARGGLPSDRNRRRARLHSFLYRRGFGADIIRQTLERHLEC